MNCRSLIFSQHAIAQMIARAISTDEFVAAVKSGEIIESYSDDKPFLVFYYSQTSVANLCTW